MGAGSGGSPTARSRSGHPNGKNIAFVGRRRGKADLCVMNVDGSGERRLTRTPDFGERIFAWSPVRTN